MTEATLRAGLQFLLAGGSQPALARLMALRVKLLDGPDPEQATADRSYQRAVFARRLVASRRISEGELPVELAA